MHTNRISPARKILAWLAAVAVLALLSGCDTVTLTNLTPGSMPENPSQIYTFTLRVTPRTNTVPLTSIAPHVIVDGKSFDMKRSPIGEGNNIQTPLEVYTDLTRTQIVRRYVLSLEVNRGPVGSRVSVLGRGFTPQDTVNFNGSPARTVCESPNALSFFVPPLESGRNYQITLNSAAGNSPIGSFRIDASSVSVTPSSLTLRTGSKQTLTFSIPNAAPPGGTLLDISTNVPDSIIMPEVIVAQGQTSVTVTVEGGKPGNGSLFLKGFGSGEVNVAVSVTAK